MPFTEPLKGQYFSDRLSPMDVYQLERPWDVTRPDLCRQGICSRTTGRLGVKEMFEAVKRDAALTRRSGMPSFVHVRHVRSRGEGSDKLKRRLVWRLTGRYQDEKSGSRGVSTDR